MAGDGDIQCGVCRRSLLTGERPLAYLDPRSGGEVVVCPLCVDRAERNGWQLVEQEQRQVAAVADDADRTVRLLKAQVNTLQTQLESTVETLEDTRDHSTARATELDTLAARLADAEAEGAAVRAALAETERRLEQVRHELEESRAAQTTLMRARRREADEVYLAGIAAEVFNRSPQAATIGLLTGLHGAPAVQNDVIGIDLPRTVRIRFGWPQGGRDYRVDVDLVARRFDLVDLV
ncbi:MAG: hypothetical protein ACR2JV_08910, partial [Gaiellales bacterium]